jgi:hypothetical protein
MNITKQAVEVENDFLNVKANVITPIGKIRMTLRDMASKSKSYGKNFAAVGLVYSAVECFIEKVQGSCYMDYISTNSIFSNELNMTCIMWLRPAA